MVRHRVIQEPARIFSRLIQILPDLHIQGMRNLVDRQVFWLMLTKFSFPHIEHPILEVDPPGRICI